MARRRPEVDTRAALIEAAWRLVAVHGFDGTSVNAVVREAGLSKGTFYHWFESKDALLDALVNRLLDSSFGAVQIVGDDALSRLSSMLSSGRDWRLAHAPLLREVMTALHRDDNLALRRRVNNRVVALALPLLTDILAQGAAEGLFQVDEPEVLAEILLRTGNAIGELQVGELLSGRPDLDRIRARARAYHQWVERGLGAPEGSLSALDEHFEEDLASFMAGAG